jgi:hypothetical protein
MIMEVKRWIEHLKNECKINPNTNLFVAPIDNILALKVAANLRQLISMIYKNSEEQNNIYLLVNSLISRILASEKQ